VLIGGSATTIRIAEAKADGDFTPIERTTTGDLSAAQFNQLAGVQNVQVLVGRFDSGSTNDIVLVGGGNWSSLPTARFTVSGSTSTITTRNATTLGLATAARVGSTKKLAGDFNGDGLSDVLLLGPAGSTQLRVAFSNGDGTYAEPMVPAGAGSVLSVEQINSLALAANVQALVGDFDGDGRQDVALTGNSAWRSIPVVFFRSGMVVTTNRDVGNDWGGWAATSGVERMVGRFNSDGQSDIALTGGTGWTTIPVAASNGDGSFTISNHQAGDGVMTWGAWASNPDPRLVKLVGRVR
jgi:hypothetical protein